MISYCYVDTCVLSDILKQYNSGKPNNSLIASKFIKSRILTELNKAIDSSGDDAMIITSIFSFVELINKFHEIFSETKIKPIHLYSFLKQPPAWITIEDMTQYISLFLCDVPQTTLNGEPISGDDAIHLATAMSRGEKINFCTTDTKLEQLSINNITFITN